MKTYYSPVHPDVYGRWDASIARYIGIGKEIAGMDKSYALWNLAWISFPEIDSHLSQEHEPQNPGPAEKILGLMPILIKTLDQKIKGVTVKKLLRKLNPVEFTDWISGTDHSHLKIYKALGSSWFTAIKRRASQFRGPQSRSDSVIFTNFGYQISTNQNPKIDRCNCRTCEIVNSKSHLEYWKKLTSVVPIYLSESVLSDSIWWTTHSSGQAVRARGMSKHLFESNHGLTIIFGRNAFHIESAIKKCAAVFLDRATRAPFQTQPACSVEIPIARDLQCAISSSVGNSNESAEYLDNYPVSDGMLNFGAHSICLNDFIDSLNSFVKEQSPKNTSKSVAQII